MNTETKSQEDLCEEESLYNFPPAEDNKALPGFHDVDWDKREEELLELLEEHRSKKGLWDVIVPSSGGKDSVFVSHQLKYKYNMNPLTVTWAPLEYTKIGKQNLEASIKAGLPNFLFTPNGNFQRKLARLCFEELGDAFHVFVLGQV